MRARRAADERLLIPVAIAVVLFGVFVAHDATLVQAGTYAAIFAVAAIGLSVLVGNVAIVSIGQAGFFAIGAYTLAYLTTAVTWPAHAPAWVPFAVATLAGTAAAALAGLAVGSIALRLGGHDLAMATLAFGLIVVGVVRASPAFGGSSGLSNVPFGQLGPVTLSGTPAYWYAWGVVALVALLTTNLLRGRTGRAFEAIRSDALAAAVAGVPVRRERIAAFAYAGALAGLAGTFYASYLGLVEPADVGVPLSIDVLLMAVLGGAGSVSGAVVGASVIGIANVFGHGLENWRPVAYGAVVVAIAIAFPRGLAGLVRPPRMRAPQIGADADVTDDAGAARPDGAARRDDAGGRASGRSDPREDAVPPLAVARVTKRFGGLVAVDDVSFELAPGTLTSLIGPNGAGKTTLFNAIGGIGRVDAGRIEVAGRDVTAWEPHRIAALGVGRSFQNARLFADLTVFENVALGAFARERATFADDLLALRASRRSGLDAEARAASTLAHLGLAPLAATLAGELAFGERRRVELARALAGDPHLLLVDEPAAGLNARERAQLRDDLRAIRSRGVTLLLIEHDMRLVMDISDRVMVLRQGRLIADGTPASVRSDRAVIAAYLGTPA